MKKNEKLLDAIGQIDERYIAEALEPLKPEDTGTLEEKKTGQQKKGRVLFFRQRRQIAAAAALVICIGAAGIVQWKLHSEEPGVEMSAYDTAELAAEDGIALQADNAQNCFAEIYLEVVAADSGKITWRIVNESSTESVSWNNDYTLERLTENDWEMVEKAAALETQEEMLQGTIAAGETTEETLDLAATGIQLEAGQYRLKKECRIFDDENSSQTGLSAEFQVEP